jgi:hypothetical protein
MKGRRIQKRARIKSRRGENTYRVNPTENIIIDYLCRDVKIIGIRIPAWAN